MATRESMIVERKVKSSCSRKFRPSSSTPTPTFTKNITCQLLRSLTNDPLGSVTFLDLSFAGIHRINGLATCPNIEVVILHGNCIDLLPNFSCCKQIWKLDLSCNRIKNLSGFEYFRTLGTLVLCENEIEWLELLKIRHLQILSLNLLGNKKLVDDPNYRKHIIVNLPSLWFLDGELITAKERLAVSKFFQSSVRSKSPVWMKLPSRQHTPTFMKICANVVYGKRATSVSQSFGRNETHNQTLDEKRMLYLSKDLNEDSVLELQSFSEPNLITWLFECRQGSVDECNMLLLMLICSLLFCVPTTLMNEILQASNLTNIGRVPCKDIFELPLQIKTIIVSLLVSCLKLDKDIDHDNGISVLLYQKLKALNMILTKVAYGSNDIKVNNDLHNIIAVEFVKIFCLVPGCSQFFKEESVMEIIISATKNSNIKQKINAVLNAEGSFCAKKACIEMITAEIEAAKYSEKVPSVRISCRKSLLKPQEKYRSGQFPERQCRMRPATAPPFMSKSPSDAFDMTHGYKIHHSVGDKVLLSAQRIGHIISIPDVNIILIQIDTLPTSKYQQADFLKQMKLSEHSLCYVDADSLVWDRSGSYWVTKQHLQQQKNHSEDERIGNPQKTLNVDYDIHSFNNTLPHSISQQHVNDKTMSDTKLHSGNSQLVNNFMQKDRKAHKSTKQELVRKSWPERKGLSTNLYSKQWINYDISMLTKTRGYPEREFQPHELKCSKLEPFPEFEKPAAS